MKLYVAGSFDHREEISRRADSLRLLGHVVTSNWLNEPPVQHGDSDHEAWEKRARAHEDIMDIRRAEGIVIFTEWPSTSGGYHSELMLAWTEGIEIYVVGPRTSIFFYLSDVQVFDSTEDLAGHLDFIEA